MNKPNTYPLRGEVLTGLILILIAFAVFWAMGGVPTLNPTSIDWIFNNDNRLGAYWENDKYFMIDYDFPQHYLGWDYFRHTPLWQFPLGLNPDCGMELSSSIIYTDSMPLAAFFFRCFDALLPEHFQYFGGWIFACYILQAVFGYILARFFTQRRLPCLLMATFFVLTPVFLWRTQCQASLSNHWVILMALWFYLRPRFARVGWILLFAVASMLSIYFLPMLGGLLLADVIRRGIADRSSLRVTLPTFVASPLAALLLLYVTGAFVIPNESMRTSAFVGHRTNLVAPFDPDFLWSETLVNIPNNFTFYEGFAYLGGGIIVLLAGALFLWGIAKKSDSLNNCYAEHLTKTHARVLSIFAVIFLINALSNRIAIGEFEFLEFDVGFLSFYTECFRASGRMFWVTTYCLYLGIFALLVRSLRTAPLICILTGALIFQCWDMQKVFLFFHDMNDGQKYVSTMKDPCWQSLGKRYSKLRVVFPSGYGTSTWKDLAIFADTHHMSINSFYLARWDKTRKDIEDKKLWEILNGKRSYDADTLYIFTHNNPKIWEAGCKRASSSDMAREIDGYKVIAPGMNDVTTATQNSF